VGRRRRRPASQSPDATSVAADGRKRSPGELADEDVFTRNLGIEVSATAAG
jgi:hypothetical protein